MEDILFEYIEKYTTLTPEEKQIITDLAIFKDFKKGSILLKEGQFSSDNYLVITGCLRTYYIVDGEERTTAFYTESNSFTPVCTVNGTASDHYIACVEDSIVTVGNNEINKTIFEKFPRFKTLCRSVTEELLANNQSSFDNFKITNPEQRYLDLLKNKPGLMQRVPQHQLASYLGIKPQSLSRIRKRLLQQASV